MSVFVAFGANLPGPYGPPVQSFQSALQFLKADGVSVLDQSSLWESAPVPLSRQPWYVNAVIRVGTELPPAVLLAVLHRIEAVMGRIRAGVNDPRAVDLDLLAYGTEVLQASGPSGLHVPHPRMHERAFVLFPMQEIAPNWTHPVSGMGLADMLGCLDPSQQIRRITGL